MTNLFLLCRSEDGDCGGSGGVMDPSELSELSRRMLDNFGSSICRNSHSTKSAHSFSTAENDAKQICIYNIDK